MGVRKVEQKIVSLADWQVTASQRKLIDAVLSSGRLTYGPLTQEFERKFAQLHGRKHAIFVSSGTAALQVSLQFLKEKYQWQDGDEVIVPAVTFVASVNAILHNRLKPTLVDVDPKYFDLDPRCVTQAITNRTRAIMPVDLLGQPCPIDQILKIAGQYSLKIVQDSCEAMFVNYNGQPVGSQSDIACYSTYIAHVMSTGVGGFITTNQDKWAGTLRSLIWHGRDPAYLTIDANKTKNLKKLLPERYRFLHVGHNFRLTELEAALGLGELERWQDTIARRNHNAKFLLRELLKFKDVLQLPALRQGAQHSWMFFPVVVRPNGKRDELALFLEKRGIQTRWMMPLTNQPAYQSWIREEEYPVADYLNDHALVISCHQYLRKQDLVCVVSCFEDYFANKRAERHFAGRKSRL